MRVGAEDVIDARGRTTNGKYWRSLGSHNETISYFDVPPQAAARFDKVLDHICVAK
jgi:hypothetical protein